MADKQALIVVSRPAALFAIASKLEHGNQVTRNEKTDRLATTVPLHKDWRIGRHGGDGVCAEGFDDLATFVSSKVEQVKIRSFIVALEGSGVSARSINSAFINVDHALSLASPSNVRNGSTFVVRADWF